MSNEVFKAVGRVNQLSIMTIDAYGVAVKNGFEGTVEEWLASLKGEKGDPGTPATDEQVRTALEAYMAENPIEYPNSSDEWILINDITAEEQIAEINITTDINGDAFNCKRVIAHLHSVPGATSNALYFGVGKHIWEHNFADNVELKTETINYFMEVELLTSRLLKMSMAAQGDSDFFWQDKNSGWMLRETNRDFDSIDQFIVACNGGSNTLAAGTRLRVWGLKK